MSDDILQLIDGYFDNTLDEAQMTRLEQRLADDPAAADLFAARSALHHRLIDHMIAEAYSETSTASDDLPPQRAQYDERHLRFNAWPAIAAALVLAVLAGLYWAALNHAEPSSPRMIAAGVRLGILTNTENAVFAEAAEPMQIGGMLQAGPIRLISGTAQIMFESTAVVDLTGPCEFEMTGPNQGRLILGQLEAYVPDRAHGFALDLPHQARVIDLGTRFGVDLNPRGISDIRVLEGRVRIERGDQVIQVDAENIATIDPASDIITLRQAPLNLVQNAGFEDFANADPARAAAWSDSVYPAHQARTREQARTGASSLKIFTAPDGRASSDIRQDVYVTPDTWGRPYEFTIYVFKSSRDQTPDTMNFFAYLRPRKADSTILQTQATTRITAADPNDQWIRLTLTGIVPAETQRFLIQLNATELESASPQAMYLDDVRLTIGDSVTSEMMIQKGKSDD